MQLELLMEYTADPQLPIPNTDAGPFGTRGFAVVPGGNLEGPMLKGTIRLGGSDWFGEAWTRSGARWAGQGPAVGRARNIRD